MRRGRGLTPASTFRSWTVLNALIVTAMALAVSGCSGDGSSTDPEAQELCDGAVNSAAETAVERMTGSSTLSFKMGLNSHTPKELKQRALESAAAEEDPWESSVMRWFCSVGDRGGEKTLGLGASWSLVNFSYISKEVQKGSKEYLAVSSDVFIKQGDSDRTEVYFPCQVTDGSKKSAMYTLAVDVSTDGLTSKDAESDANKVALSVARWMSGRVGCVNDPQIPTSA